MSGYTGYALRFISGKYQGNEYPLKADYEVILGRGSELEIVLMEDMVSRHHAKIVTGSDYVIIQDLGSTNGTFVNGERIRKIRLKEGDRILIGTSILKMIPFEGEVPVEASAPAGMPDNRLLGPGSSAPNPPAPRALLGPASSSSNDLSVPSATKHLPAFDPGAMSPSSARLDSVPRLDFSSPSSASLAPPAPLSSSALAAAPLSFGPPKIGNSQMLPKATPPELGQALMTGDLDETPLQELLDLFATSRRNGVLVISNKADGRLHIRDGRLIYAIVDDYHTIPSQTAATRIMTWTKGTYALYAPHDQSIQQEGNDDLLQLLQSANRTRESLKRFDLSPNIQTLGVPSPLEAPLRELRPEQLEIFQLAMNSGSVNAILGLTRLNELEAYQQIGYLLKHNYITGH